MNPTNPRPPSNLLPLPLLLLAALAPASCDAPERDDATDPGEFRELAPDPAAAASYGWCPQNGTFNGIHTLVRYPTATDCSEPLVDRPFVLVLRGNTYSYTTYDYLLEHLAKNGFIVAIPDLLAAADSDGSYIVSAEQAEDLLDELLATWPKAYAIDPTRLGIVGHSRGGKTARYLADVLKGGADPWTVRAIVSLAGQGGPEHPFDPSMTTAALMLQGSLDTDIFALKAYGLYDTAAGGESSVAWPQPGLYKAMKLLHGVPHSSFSEKLGLGPVAHVAKGYTLAFLSAHLDGDMTWYEDYIRGDAVPFGAPIDVTGQVSDGFLRTVIDNFEDGFVGATPLGGAVDASHPGLSAAIVDLSSDVDSPHVTSALRVGAKQEGTLIEWSIPQAHGDATPYRWLSLRVGQLSGAPATDLRVQIINDGVPSAELVVTDHGVIPTPETMCRAGVQFGCNSYAAEHMGTIRIPLDDFADRDDVEAVRLVFRGDALRKSFLVDSLELSEWIHKP